MASYVVPQVEIHQLFSEIPVALAQNQVPFVFGPNYLLHRFTEASEKAGTYVGEYDSAKQADLDSSDSSSQELSFFFPYNGVLDQEKIDNGYTKVFADNCVVALQAFTSVAFAEDSAGNPIADKLVIDVSTTPDKATELSAGRMLRLYASGLDEYLTDVRIVKADVSESDDEVTVTIEIDEELATDTVFDAAVLCEIQNGVEITRNDEATAAKTGNKDNFNWEEDKEVDSTTGEVTFGIRVDRKFQVKIQDEDFVTDDNKGYGEVLSADLYVQYRELINAASDTIHTLTYASEVIDALGAVSPDNPLAQAVYNAALNSGGQIVRYMAVPTNDLDGYSKVLNAATLTKEVYFLVPVTRDSTILDLVQSHVNDMSAPTTKRWRIAFVSAEIPNYKALYTSARTTDGRDFKARVVAEAGSGIYKTVDLEFRVSADVMAARPAPTAPQDYPDPDTRFKKDVRVGDIVEYKTHTEWGEVKPYRFLVTKVLSNNKLRVSDPDDLLRIQDLGLYKAEVYHPYTNAEKAEVIRDLSSSFSDRRIYNVFPSQFIGGGVTQTGEFAAACVAGLVASCLPQQPVTNLELVGIDDVPMTYETFSYYELNTIASGGTFIVMQDLPHDQVYIRHQISTAYEDNNLNTAELSITKNLDSISYFFDDLCSPYIGKYNITPELLLVLRNVILGGLTRLENTAWGLYGPQVIAEGTEILLLEQDALLKDHVNCNLKLNLPYPFNHLVLKLFV